MKTFEEDLKLVAQEVGTDQVDPKLEEFKKSIEDTTSKYREILEEARTSLVIEKLIMCWIYSSVQDSTYNGIMSSYFSAFTAGLIVGIDMTKFDFTEPIEENK